MVAEQAIADLAHFTFSNGTSSEVVITSLKMNRLGVSEDATLSKVYLYDGATRITDEAIASSGVLTWNNASGIIVIPANTVKTISVKSDILTGTQGQTVGVGIASVDYITSNVATINGTFPINGSIHTIAQATLAGFDFSSSTTPGDVGSLSPQNNYIMFENSVTIGTRAVDLKSITFRNIGSVSQNDLQNLKLMIDGVQVGPTIATPNANGYFTFDMTSNPVRLEAGSRLFSVVGDIVGGSTRTFKIAVYKASDVTATDSQYNVNVLPKKGGASFSPVEAGTQTIAEGVLTITKSVNSPSGNIAKGASQVSLAKFDLKATGEPIKIENLRVTYTASDDAISQLRNGSLYVDGVAIGSIRTLNEDSHATLAYTEYSLGSSLIVTPGTTKVLEVRADVFDNDGTDSIVAGSTIQVNLAAGSTNYQRMTSGSYASTGAVPANTLQVTLGSLAATIDQSYGSQSVVVPQTNVLLGKFNVSAGSGENVNLNTIRVAIKVGGTGSPAPGDITNLYVKYGTKETTPIATATALNTFSISQSLTKTQSIVVEVYGDIAAGTAGGTYQTQIQASGITAQSGTAVYTRGSAAMAAADDAGSTPGQIITAAGSGNLTVTLDNTTPLAAQVLAGSAPEAGSLKIRLYAETGNMYVKRIDLRVDDDTNDIAVQSVDLYAAQGSGTYVKVGTTMPLNTDGTNPGFVRWILAGDQRIPVAKNGVTYLLAVPTYVSSGQADVSGKTPRLLLADMEVDDVNGQAVVPGIATLTNSTGLIIKSNNSGVYVDSTATTSGGTDAAATDLVTSDGSKFTVGDIIFIDQDAEGDYDAATEELMVVLKISTNTLTVQRGAFGTGQYAYPKGKNIYRLDSSASGRGIVGNPMTVLNTKLSLALASDSPSGTTAGGLGKIIFTFNAEAENNPLDPAENKASLTRVDITTTETAATVTNLKLYPSEFDNNATYATTCGALSSTKWRCIMNTTSGTNEIIENTSRKYIARADVGYSAAGSIAVSIANLGSSDAATNDVAWTDDKPTTMTWVNQATSLVQGGQQTTSAQSGTTDGTEPTISSITVANKTDGSSNTIENGDIITVIFSEVIDPATINVNLVPGGSVADVAADSTGGLTGVAGTAVMTITNITTFGAGASLAGAVSHTTDLALDATGKTLTITLKSGASRAITTPGLVAGTTEANTVKDVSGNVMTAATSPVPTGAF
ncbi:MAG: hypothetical protein BWY74_01665 [Firmicutes bacterium ADurb.Bin419]|nr:MAG: hypothetical protein BWY74_01665 [Firmicutes bacterium ADurb.Bin419]